MKTCFCSGLSVFVHNFGKMADCKHGGSIKKTFGKVLRFFYHLLRYLTIVSCKIMFDENAALGRNIWFSRRGNIIAGVRSIGQGSVIHHNVTFGMHLAGSKRLTGKPTIGENVWVGPDTIVHGDIVIGDGATILGGSVLTKNVPPRCVVAGNPARIIKREFDNYLIRSSDTFEVNRDVLKSKGAVDV